MGLAEIRAGGKSTLARALAALEIDADSAPTASLLDQAYHAKRAQIIGLTGPPGVGKSSLLAALVPIWRAKGQTIGVVAVDPSSKRTGGALLADRARLKTDPDDTGVFVRSMAARDRLGGLAPQTLGGVVLMAALFDIVVVETVGVGQSETDVANLADSVVFCIQPGSGDSLQFMKAGIVEIPHICVVTKADLGPAASRAAMDAAGALSLAESVHQGWTVPVRTVSSATGAGLDDLVDDLVRHGAHVRTSETPETQQSRAQSWLIDAVQDRFGRHGLARAGNELALALGQSPFGRLRDISLRLAS